MTQEKSHPIKSTTVRPKSQQVVLRGLQWLTKVSPQIGVNVGLELFQTPLMRKRKNERFPLGTEVKIKNLAGKKLTTYRYGKSHKKILLLHGWEGAASDMSSFFEPLNELGYEVFTFDLPGHGHSAFGQLNAFKAAKILRELEYKVGPFSAIIGHSFGGLSAGAASYLYPELRSIPLITVGSPNKLSVILDNFSRLVGFQKDHVPLVYKKMEETFNKKVEEMELGRFFKTHEAPILVVHDKEDKQVKVQAATDIELDHQDIQFLYTKGLGHNRILRDQKTIERICEFIERNASQRGEVEDAVRLGLL